MKRKALALLVGIGMMAGLAVGAHAEEAYKVGVCLPARDQYWTTFELGLNDQFDAAGIEYQTVVAGDQGEDVSSQISQVQTFSNNGFDAVIIGMATGGSAADFLQNTGDMKVIFFNRAAEADALDGTNSIYIGMAEYDAGYAQGEWLANYFNEAGKTEVKGLMFLGVLGQDSVVGRTQGAKDALEAGGITVDWIFEQTGEWDRTKAMNLFTQFLGTGEEFDFVCSNNDEMALGVVEACTSSNIDIDFPIVGVDATEVGCNAVKEGTMAMTVNQDPKGQAAVCVEALQAMLAGEAPEGLSEENKIATAAAPITPENVDEALSVFE
ncbi:MAG: sugar ABC transporter substrate-binding protein [Lachnospiraceae bacterium]|nr:sugar ABC transporter substrate-binding protein [Lachnospiraceae bacterium]